MLVKLSGGPLDGQEKDINDANAMAAEYPGYSAVEQVMDPERGQILKAEWNGDEGAEAAYGDERDRERYGNETGVRDRDAQDRARRGEQDPNEGEAVNRKGGNETTSAQKRENKGETGDAKTRSARGGDGNKN